MQLLREPVQRHHKSAKPWIRQACRLLRLADAAVLGSRVLGEDLGKIPRFREEHAGDTRRYPFRSQQSMGSRSKLEKDNDAIYVRRRSISTVPATQVWRRCDPNELCCSWCNKQQRWSSYGWTFDGIIASASNELPLLRHVRQERIGAAGAREVRCLLIRILDMQEYIIRSQRLDAGLGA